jgi:hypothetical protein
MPCPCKHQFNDQAKPDALSLWFRFLNNPCKLWKPFADIRIICPNFQLLHPPIPHCQHPVAKLGQFFVMGNYQEGLVKLFAQVKKEVVQFFGIG